jgi:organic radical activating enzyme
VETNGTKRPTPEFQAAVDQFNVSPKLANSGMDERLRVSPDVLAAFAADPKAWFKFVARDAADLAEIDTFAGRFGLPADKILVMPEGRSSAELDRHAREIAPRCIARGWRFCDRLHVRLWGDRRGV